ncbi:MAG: hypothetical protein AAF564_18705 [Bacteroidota bacterium]
MAKKSKSGRGSKEDLQKNAAWLEHRLEGTMLDLEALSAMPINDVQAELKAIKKDQKDLVKAINERLPAGASIPVPKTPAKKRRKPQARKAADRKPATSQPARRPSRIISFRGALVLSLLIIASAVIIPQFIKNLRDDKMEPAQAIEENGVETPDRSPTWIVGPAVDELIRGVKYTIEGLEQVVIHAPLPTNPGDLQASFRMRMTVDSDGKVIRLEPLSNEAAPFEPTVMDSLLHWRFSALAASDSVNNAVVTIEYIPE